MLELEKGGFYMENLMIPKKEQIFGECRLKPIEKRGTACFNSDSKS